LPDGDDTKNSSQIRRVCKNDLSSMNSSLHIAISFGCGSGHISSSAKHEFGILLTD